MAIALIIDGVLGYTRSDVEAVQGQTDHRTHEPLEPSPTWERTPDGRWYCYDFALAPDLWELAIEEVCEMEETP